MKLRKHLPLSANKVISPFLINFIFSLLCSSNLLDKSWFHFRCIFLAGRYWQKWRFYQGSAETHPHYWTRTLDSVITCTLEIPWNRHLFKCSRCYLATDGRLLLFWIELWLIFHCDSSALSLFCFVYLGMSSLGAFWSYEQIYIDFW